MSTQILIWNIAKLAGGIYAGRFLFRWYAHWFIGE